MVALQRDSHERVQLGAQKGRQPLRRQNGVRCCSEPGKDRRSSKTWSVHCRVSATGCFPPSHTQSPRRETTARRAVSATGRLRQASSAISALETSTLALWSNTPGLCNECVEGRFTETDAPIPCGAKSRRCVNRSVAVRRRNDKQLYDHCRCRRRARVGGHKQPRPEVRHQTLCGRCLVR